MEAVNVVYRGRRSRSYSPTRQESGFIELLSDNWDDYGYKTSFGVSANIGGQDIDLGSIRLLIDGQDTSAKYLDALLQQGWDGFFPIPKTNYISVPGDITFYEQLEGLLPPEDLRRVAELLRDASFLVRIANDEAAAALTQSAGFSDSLQRERGSVKAYLDGWRVFERAAIDVLNLGFQFNDVYGNSSHLDLRFQSESPLPHDINVLIGPNGVGKSQALHQMVGEWIDPSSQEGVGFEMKPNLSQIVVVSYSPFERFPVDLKGKRLQDLEAYQYFGLRGRGGEQGSASPIELSHIFPKRNAAHALINCAADDLRYRSIRDWSNKTETMERVLRSAFEFDFAAVEVPASGRLDRYYHGNPFSRSAPIEYQEGDTPRRFIPVTREDIDRIEIEQLSRRVKAASGVTFFREDRPIELSSGQRLFAYIVINILGAIRRNSLLLIDEPELFLHPTLEIQFIDMLKEILAAFNSKALLATHSVVTVREVPSDCVHVMARTTDGLVINNPPFQTFGGDFQRISSYVFGDRTISKPFEEWIRDQLEERGSADALLEVLGNDISEELIVQIKAMGAHKW